MKRGLRQLVMAAIVVTLVGCGTTSQADAFDGMSESEVFELRDAGSASGDLLVRVKIEADAERDNATNAQDFETDIQVEVSRNGQAVRDAVVTVEAYEGPKVNLDFDGTDDGVGEYEAEIRGYHRAYRVDVEAGEDRLEGAYLAGPAIHSFTAPEQNARVPAGEDLELVWEADDEGADQARIDGDGFEEREIDDSGSYRVEAARLGDDDGDDDDDEFELERWNEMELSSLASGSIFVVEVKNDLEVRLQR